MKNDQKDIESLVDFMAIAGNLKWIKRSGWLRENMLEPETVAEHTYRVVLLSKLIAPILKLNSEKLTTMALLHDLPEAILGDSITQRGSKQIAEHDLEKEKKIMKKIFYNAKLIDFYDTWEEQIQENGPKATKYSTALYQIGKIATVWQALEYEKKGMSKEKLNEFWINAKKHIKIPYLIELLKALQSARKFK